MDILTGKARELFAEWYNDNHPTSEYVITSDIEEYYINYCMFIYYPLSMQWGVILEFADSLGMLIEIATSTDSELNPDGTFEWYITDLNSLQSDYYNRELIHTRKEAQLEALKQLNIIINK